MSPATQSPTPLDAESCYRALSARDARFDGVFFVGVTTTGIYCRPICPARRPSPGRCRFFACAAEAEQAGFRACFRCRPELAPGTSRVDALSGLAASALRLIEAGFLDERSLDELAAELGVTARHLRRALAVEVGVSPVELAQTRRLALARQLLRDTGLPLIEVAQAAGFGSLRRFNAVFRERVGRAPSALRRAGGGVSTAGESIRLRLDYRPPFDWPALLAFLAARAIPGVEAVTDGAYHRQVALDGASGWVSVRPAARRPALMATVALSLLPRLAAVVAGLRALFDLDAEPAAITAHLGRDPELAPRVAHRPGLRVPGAFDTFETAARVVLGQQVSVAAATTLSGRLAERFGKAVAPGPGGTARAFPAAAELAQASAESVAAVGLPLRRAQTLVALAQALAGGHLRLTPGGPPEAAVQALLALPGLGPWTAHAIAMRVLHWPDAFPSGDLGLRRALRASSPAAAERRAQAWRPWRAYAAMHLWQPDPTGV